MENINFSKDAYFKKIIKNKQLVAYILKHFVQEYEHLEIEEIIPLLTLQGVTSPDTKEVIGLDSEINDPLDGKILLDKVIGAYLPDSKEQICIVFDLEMQTSTLEDEKLYNRAEYYVSALMRSQKGVIFDHSDYENMIKVTGIWFCL